MTPYSLRPFALGASLLGLTACMSPAPAIAEQRATEAPVLGVDLGSSARAPAAPMHTVLAMPGQDRGRRPATPGKAQLAQAGHGDARATGMVNSVDVAGHKINLSHDPIPALGWPAMTMDFAVAPSVNLNAVKPGTRVNFVLEKGAGGMYEVQSVEPAGGRR